MLRHETPGVPDLFTGRAQKDPLPITIENVHDHLVGWMTLEQIARSLGLATAQSKTFLLNFLNEHHDFAQTREDGIVKWSNFQEKR